MNQQQIKKGIDKVKKADMLLNQTSVKPLPKANEFKIEVKGNRQEAFKPSHFKLFE